MRSIQRHSAQWKGSKRPSKQRNYRTRAPLHTRSRFLIARLSKDLREKHGLKRLRVRTGDKVRIVRGQFRMREGKVERVDLASCKLYITKVDQMKKDGATRVPYPIDPSNCILVDLDTSDKRRAEKLKARKETKERK